MGRPDYRRPQCHRYCYDSRQRRSHAERRHQHHRRLAELRQRDFAPTVLTFAGPGSTSVTGVISDGGGAAGTGSGAVALNGASGTLTLSNANTYTGGTTVSHGTLAVASIGVLGSGPVTMSGGVLQLQLVQGTPIGIKFATGRAATPETPEQLSGPAGAPGAVVNNWNNVIVADNAGVVTAPPAAAGSSSIPFALTDGNTAATSVSLAHYAGSNTYSVYNATQGGSGGIGTGIQQLMNSYIDNNAGTGGTANPAVAGLSGLNYVKYDIYVYFGSDGNGRSGALNLFTGSTDETGTLAGTFYYSTDANHGAATAYELTSDSTAATYPNADYAIFTGQTASSFAVDTVAAGTAINHTGIFAVEVVPYVGALFANSVTVNGSATIDVTGPSSATLSGPVTMGNNAGGSIALSVTGTGAGAGTDYSLVMPSGIALTGNNSSYTLNVANNGAGTGTFRVGGLNTSLTPGATLIKAGAGTVEVNAASNLSNGTSIDVNSGRVRFNVASGQATIGSGVTATVASGATLELTGAVSALSSPASAASRVNVINNSQQTSGGSFTVTGVGSNQQVGAISGSGDTVVSGGSNLTANSIVQNALVIGGDMTNAGVVTIAASDASGNPLSSGGGLAAASALSPSASLGGGSSSASDLASSGADGFSSANEGPASASPVGGASAVPEPSSWVLLAIAASASLAVARRRRRSAG